MTVTPRREALCQAALDVITERGLRGLTHRAVDQQARLPQGTTSAYYRTRAALQCALAGFVTDLLSADVAALADDLKGSDLDDPHAVELVARRFADWLSDGRLVLARIELVLEATRDAGVAAALGDRREQIIALVAQMLVSHDVEGADRAPQRAEVMVAAYDGVLLAALLKPRDQQVEFLDLAVAEILRPLRRY